MGERAVNHHASLCARGPKPQILFISILITSLYVVIMALEFMITDS